MTNRSMVYAIITIASLLACRTITIRPVTQLSNSDRQISEKAFECYLVEEYRVPNPPNEFSIPSGVLRERFSPQSVSIIKDLKYYGVKLFLKNQNPPDYLISKNGNLIFLKYHFVELKVEDYQCQNSNRMEIVRKDVTGLLRSEVHSTLENIGKTAFKDKFSTSTSPIIIINELEFNPDLWEIYMARGVTQASSEEICIGPGCLCLVYVDKQTLEVMATW